MGWLDAAYGLAHTLTKKNYPIQLESKWGELRLSTQEHSHPPSFQIHLNQS